MDRSPSPSPLGPGPRERMIHLRLMLLALAVSLWGLIIGVRLFDLQVLERSFFEKQSARQSERTINLDPRRGPILDRNGRPLAVSVEAESIYAVPQDIEDPARTAAALGRALGLDAAGRRDLAAQLQKSRAFVWVKRKADPGTARAVRDLSLDGVGFLNETRRYYPQRELMSQVLGYVGLDNTGMSGVEYAFEDRIQGRAAKVVVQTDARRRPTGQTKRPSTDGHTVVLTLDESIQHVAERELERAVTDSQAQSGVAVVVDPWTGEVLAMANWPTFNPNRFGAYPSARWKNRAVSDAYEPGSIFKIVTAAAGIQEKAVETEEILDCGNGSHRHRRGPHQRPRGLRQALVPDGGRQVERHRHDPRGPAYRSRQHEPLHARLRLRRAHRHRSSRRVVGPPASAQQVERHLPGLAVLRPGGRGHRPADDHGRGRGGQRRLPDEAAGGEADREPHRRRGQGDEAGRGAARARAPDRGGPHRHPDHGGEGRDRPPRRASPASRWRARRAPPRRWTPPGATRWSITWPRSWASSPCATPRS